MALHFGPTNNTKPASFALGFWNLVQAWLAAGWTIKASGDGLAAYSAVGSVFSNGGASGANGFDNSGAWLRIAMPGASGREFCILRGSASSTTGSYAIAVSPANKFVNGGSATVAASATDQQFVLGSALTVAGSAQLMGGTVGNNYYNAMADDAAPYGFYLFGFPAGNGTDNCAFVGEALTGLSSGSGGTDPDPYVYWAGAGGDFGRTDFASPPMKGFAAGVWGTHASVGPAAVAAASVGNPYTQGHDLISAPIFTLSVGNSADYLRGYTTIQLQDFHANIAANHSPLNYQGGSNNRVLVGNWTLPWDGSAVITT